MPATERHPLIDRAYQARRDGDRRSALALYLEAARVLYADGRGDIAGVAHAVRHAADLHEELGESDDAWRKYNEAWGFYQTLEPEPELDLANCLRPMALWQETHGLPSRALPLWREARDWYEKAGAATGLDLQPAFDECDRHIKVLEG